MQFFVHISLTMASFGSLSAMPSFFNISACEPFMAHWLSMISPANVSVFGLGAAKTNVAGSRTSPKPAASFFIEFLLNESAALGGFQLLKVIRGRVRGYRFMASG